MGNATVMAPKKEPAPQDLRVIAAKGQRSGQDGAKRSWADRDQTAFEFLSASAKIERAQLLTLSAMALEVLIVGYRKCPYLAQVYIPTPTLYGPELITGDAIRAADW
jgi:hypothetical protein